MFCRFPLVKSSSVNTPDATDKKRDSRRSGFFNYIKSRTSRSEKSHGAASITPPKLSLNTATNTITSPVIEETTPTSPNPPVKSPTAVAEPHLELHRALSSNHTDSEREALPTADEPAVEEEEKNGKHKENTEKAEITEKKENVEKKENPHVHRHIGVPVMGKDLLAEMKARQERTRQEKMTEKKVRIHKSSNLLLGQIYCYISPFYLVII